MIEARLVPLLDLAAQLGLLDVAQRFQLPLGLAEPRLRILQRQLLLLALHARKKFARHGIELGSPDVVARLRQVRLRLLLLNAVLRSRLADFLFGLLELGAPVVRACAATVIGSNRTTTSPFLMAMPFLASSRICRSPPPVVGTVSATERTAFTSPRTCR